MPDGERPCPGRRRCRRFVVPSTSPALSQPRDNRRPTHNANNRL
jgi:hypothetical protein